jgi:hypothetical protein
MQCPRAPWHNAGSCPNCIQRKKCLPELEKEALLGLQWYTMVKKKGGGQEPSEFSFRRYWQLLEKCWSNDNLICHDKKIWGLSTTRGEVLKFLDSLRKR